MLKQTLAGKYLLSAKILQRGSEQGLYMYTVVTVKMTKLTPVYKPTEGLVASQAITLLLFLLVDQQFTEKLQNWCCWHHYQGTCNWILFTWDHRQMSIVLAPLIHIHTRIKLFFLSLVMMLATSKCQTTLSLLFPNLHVWSIAFVTLNQVFFLNEVHVLLSPLEWMPVHHKNTYPPFHPHPAIGLCMIWSHGMV